jgi:hypothetical protein
MSNEFTFPPPPIAESVGAADAHTDGDRVVITINVSAAPTRSDYRVDWEGMQAPSLALDLVCASRPCFSHPWCAEFVAGRICGFDATGVNSELMWSLADFAFELSSLTKADVWIPNQ